MSSLVNKDILDKAIANSNIGLSEDVDGEFYSIYDKELLLKNLNKILDLDPLDYENAEVINNPYTFKDHGSQVVGAFQEGWMKALDYIKSKLNEEAH